MSRFLALAIVLIGSLPSAVEAQVVKISQPICELLRCREGIGSGVVIGRTGLPDGNIRYHVLTVYHLTGKRWDVKVKQALTHGVDLKMSVVTNAGRYPAKVASSNGELKLLMLTIDVPGHLPLLQVMRLADELPRAGDSVEIRGFSHRRNCEFGARSLTLRSVGPDYIECASPFEEGESGGPIVKDGVIVGLCEGTDVRKIGWGPSIVAIRRFLGLPACGQGSGGRPAGVPVRGGVSVSTIGPAVPVPPPPAPDDAVEIVTAPTDGPGEPAETDEPEDRGGDAPRYTPPAVVPRRAIPVAEPDPISGPEKSDGIPAPSVEDVSPLPTKPAASDSPSPAVGSVSASTGTTDTVVSKVKRGAMFGLDLLSLAAGAGLIVGTGGVGTLAVMALRGLKAGKQLADLRRAVGATHSEPDPTIAPIARPVGYTVQYPPRIIPTEAPPLPRQVISTATFTPYEVDSHQKAYEWAKDNIGRRWPGSIPSIVVIDNLMAQYRAGAGTAGK